MGSTAYVSLCRDLKSCVDGRSVYFAVSQARSIPVRKDDEVLIVRGTYKGREGKVRSVS